MKEDNSYYPSNGTEGDQFQSVWCDKCYKKNSCSILNSSYTGKHVKQWIYDDDMNPTCTSFNANRPAPKHKENNNLPTLF